MQSKLPNRTYRFFNPLVFCVFLLNCILCEKYAKAQNDVSKVVSNISSEVLGPDQAGELLLKSVELIEGRQSISAEVTYCVELFGKKLSGKGQYCEERSGPRPLVRFEMKTPDGESESNLLQVSDGRYLWIYHSLMGEPRLDRVDVEQLEKAVENIRRAGGRAPGGAGLIDAAALGGMAGVLLSLQESFLFDSARSDTLYDTPVWKLRGRWRATKLPVLFPELSQTIRQGRGEVDLKRLPPRLPVRVLVLLGKDDLFPYRIEYCRDADGGGNPRTIMAMQLYRVSFNVPLDKSIFEYQPSEAPVADRTTDYVTKVTRRAKVLAAH